MRHLAPAWALLGGLVLALGCAKGSEQATSDSGHGGSGGSPGPTTSSSGTGGSDTGGTGSGTGGSDTGGGGAASSSASSSSSSASSSSSSSSSSASSSSGGPTCGDGMVDPGEECDGANLNGKSCIALGFVGGTLTCTAGCKLDTTKCDACGNGMIQPQLGEDCDFDAMNNPLILATCQSLGFNSPKNPGCDPACHYDTTPCLCGNAMIDGAEQCDGPNLNGQSCASLGFTAGTLTCNSSCQFVTSGCTKCGNGILEAGEGCDDGNVVSNDGCSSTCTPEVIACDPDGAYAIIQGGPITYSCCFGLVNVNVNSFILQNDGAKILSSPSNPIAMNGAATTCPSGSFSNTGTIPGMCAETYSVSGTFIDDLTWSGVYTLSFQGPDCDCFNGFGTPCVGQAYPITAKR